MIQHKTSTPRKPQIQTPPGPLVMGEGILVDLETILKNHGLEPPVLFIADETTWALASSSLDSFASSSGSFNHAIDSATVSEVSHIEKKYFKDDVRSVAGLGGGRPIDVGKLTAHRKNVPFISIPTSPSHDGVASGRASLMHLGAKTSIQAKTPRLIVADTAIIRKAPPRFASSGCADILSNMTAILDWELSRRVRGGAFIQEAYDLSKEAGELVYDFQEPVLPGHVNELEDLMRALVMSGKAMALAGSSRPASGAEHKFAHVCETLLPDSNALHGELCGIGSIITMHLHQGDWMGIRDALVRVGAPVTAKELNIRDEVIVNAFMRSQEIRPERYTILEHLSPTEREMEQAIVEVGVIG